MILSIINFVYIIIISIGCGLLIKKYFLLRLDEILVAGLLISMIVAEYLSLFMGVSYVAGIIVLLVASLGYILYRKEVKVAIDSYMAISIRNKLLHLLLLFLLVIVFSLIAVQSPNYVDTGLYHAQSIRWIEEYGVVKGLGNLHHRFAYNSAFLCLQALFSWKDIVGQSLHGMNAYFAMLMLYYAIVSQHVLRGEKFSISDAVKMIIPVYILIVWNQLSSPNTDSMVLLLVVYVAVKWIEELEKGDNERSNFYAFLGLLIVAACTIKVSVAPSVLLMIKPACMYIKKKDWTSFIKWILFAIVVAFPYLARNVLISGYLLYPYPSLDIFDVDWKMNEFSVICDRKEIMVWGRNLLDIELADKPISYWFPIWYSSIALGYKVLLIINSLALFIICIYGIMKKKVDVLLLCGTSIISFLFWLLTSPYIRFGLEHLMFGICVVVGYLVKNHFSNRINGIFAYSLMLVITVILVCSLFNFKTYRKFFPNDYYLLDVCEISMDDKLNVYYPKGFDNEGYYWHFPETPYPDYVKLIELRGEDLSDGFRLKQEYKDLNITAMGEIVNYAR